MRKIVTILFFAFCTLSYGQTFKKSDFVGKWTTSNLSLGTGDAQAKSKDVVKQLKNSFLNATFDFKADGKFYIKFKNTSPIISDLEFLNDQQWIFIPEKSIIKIGSKANKHSAMHIRLQKVNGKTYFFIPGVQLEMKKG